MHQQHVVTQPMTPVTIQPVAYQQPQQVQYDRKQSMALGILLIVSGVLAIIFNGVAIGVDNKDDDYDYQTSADIHRASHGFWGGALLIITGVLAVASASSKTSKCPIIAFMILAIITAIIMISMLSLGIQGAVRNVCNPNSDYGYGYGFDCDSWYRPDRCNYKPPCNDKMRTSLAMEAMIAILAFVCGIACIWGSALCCKAVCCCSYTPTYVTAVPYGNPSVTVISQQQSGPHQQYAVRPQVMTAGVVQPQGPPPYASGQYWAPQQQQQYPGYGYPQAPYNPQMPVTNLSAPPPPTYDNTDQTKPTTQ